MTTEATALPSSSTEGAGAPGQDPHATTEISEPRPTSELEREVAAWALANRAAFPLREDFNLAICDRLAARGIPPLAGVLRRLGARGTAASQKADVDKWYAAIQDRLGSLEAQIPLAQRRQANALVEGLWKHALGEARERLVTPLQAELAQTQEALAERTAELRQRDRELDEAREQHRISSEAAAEQVRALEERLAITSAHVSVLTDQLADATAATEAARRDAAERLAAAAEKHAGELRARDAQIGHLQERAEGLVHQAAEERARLMLQVDEARQGAKEAQARAEATERRREQLQQRVEALVEGKAQAESREQAAAADRDRLQHECAQLRGEVADAASLREQLAASTARETELRAQVAQLQSQLAAARPAASTDGT